MTIYYALYILNKSGSLIFYQSYYKEKDAVKLSINDLLRLGSTFHGMYAITSELSPVPSATGGSSSGIHVLQSDTFKLQSFQTPTGIKMYLIAEPQAGNLEPSLRQVYELYSDYVLKNPFYELEQPIHCDQFDVQLEKLFLPPHK